MGKRRGFCLTCGARRMVESAGHLVDHVFLELPLRQFVLTFLFPLRFLLVVEPKALTEVLAAVQRSSRASFHRARRAQPDELLQLLDSLSRRFVRLLERV
jgi:hypothetical protein